jgi:hypothetical protein
MKIRIKFENGSTLLVHMEASDYNGRLRHDPHLTPLRSCRTFNANLPHLLRIYMCTLHWNEQYWNLYEPVALLTRTCHNFNAKCVFIS